MLEDIDPRTRDPDWVRPRSMQDPSTKKRPLSGGGGPPTPCGAVVHPLSGCSLRDSLEICLLADGNRYNLKFPMSYSI